MCGLTGLWQPAGGDPEALAEAARRMAGALVHRGPDDAGDWVDGEAGLAFAFRRLAILDVSPAGHQPMVSTGGRFVLQFNGEIYNFRELRAELEGHGAAFRGGSDTEVILAALERWDVVDAIPRLWGMFACAIWDRQARALWLARDRLGKKPLYYARASGTWLFGSELSSLRAHPACPTDIDRGALVSLLRYGYVPAPTAILAGVRKLPPATLVRLAADGTEHASAYWRARDVVRRAVTHRKTPEVGAAIEELDALLRDAVRRRMIADVPLGAFLSGGVDSSTVVALMQAVHDRPVRTFTIGFADAAYDESRDAAAVAAHLGTAHTTLPVTEADALAVVPSLAADADEPFADSSRVPTFLVARLARQHVTVALSGDGGDEVFGGYTRHVWADRVWRQMTPIPAVARRAAGAALTQVGPSAWDALYRAAEGLLPPHARQRHPGDKLRKLARLMAARDVDAIYPVLVAQWDGPEHVVVGGEEPSPWSEDEARGVELPTLTERMMFRDLVGYLPDDILTKVDRATMAASLEARAPLLDHRVVEWAWRLPLSFKIHAGEGKWLLRQVLDRYVPRPLIERPKSGFALPIGDWLRGPLRAWAESHLATDRLAREGFFVPGAIRTVWERHLRGAREETRLWPVLMFQAWGRQ
jgi:asparagine synthase (glutamine-hydrolysing)